MRKNQTGYELLKYIQYFITLHGLSKDQKQTLKAYFSSTVNGENTVIYYLIGENPGKSD